MGARKCLLARGHLTLGGGGLGGAGGKFFGGRDIAPWGAWGWGGGGGATDDFGARDMRKPPVPPSAPVSICPVKAREMSPSKHRVTPKNARSC